MKKEEMVKKPPLGLMPRFIFYEKRISNIKNAYKRYMKADKEIPRDWIDEHVYMVSWLKANKIKKRKK